LASVVGAIIATLITVPYIVFFLVNKSMLKLTKKRRKAFKAGVDCTTFFLFFAIERMTVEIWGQSYYWILLLLFLSGCLLFTYVIWKNELDLSIRKILRLNWRLQFLVLSIGYFSLMTYGVISRILDI
jgi:Ca2+/Na+ antiporter